VTTAGHRRRRPRTGARPAFIAPNCAFSSRPTKCCPKSAFSRTR